MSITTKTDVGLRESNLYAHHRFDNHSAWLDRELRNKRRVRGEPQGHGFPVPRAPAPPRHERPFFVQECGMTSGKLLTRRYDQTESSFKFDDGRSDPYHYPNHLRVEEHQHFEDRRARSQHIEPSRRKELPRDQVLRDAVPEEMVKNIIMANYKDMKVKPDPEVLKIQFDPNIRLPPETVRDLNVDLSCCDLPAREKPIESSRLRATTGSGKDWGWCLGGRRPLTPPDHGDVHMHKSTSLPGTLGGRSLLSHQVGVDPGAFHGTTFIAGEAHGRMRGGRNARSGAAGTFPEREKRPGAK